VYILYTTERIKTRTRYRIVVNLDMSVWVANLACVEKLCQERLGGGAFVMHGTDEKCMQVFGGGDQQDRNTLKDYA
jgi:hypothetical protein